MNVASWIICILLIIIICGIIMKMIQDKKQGKSCCSGGCQGCASQGACHTSKNLYTTYKQNERIG